VSNVHHRVVRDAASSFYTQFRLGRCGVRRFRRLLLITSLIGIGIPWCYGAVQAQGLILSPDLAFHFICPGEDRRLVEEKVEEFLKKNGFKVLNLARIQHEHQVFFFESDIKGLDENRRIIELRSVPPTPDRYALDVYTQPPTKRVPQLEKDVLRVVSDALRCEVRQVTSGENGVDAISYYDRVIKRIENLFLEAERLRSDRRL
jgi:hypothetical protein